MSGSATALPESGGRRARSPEAAERSLAGMPSVAPGEAGATRATGGAVAAADSPGEQLCEQCGEAPAKYRCPQCSQRTCSVTCVKAHKQEPGGGGEPGKLCTGKRQVTGFVALDDFDDNTLASDLGFLENVQRCSDNAKRVKQGLGIGYGRASRPFPLAQSAEVPLPGNAAAPPHSGRGLHRLPAASAATEGGLQALSGSMAPVEGPMGSLNGAEGPGGAGEAHAGAGRGWALGEGSGSGHGSGG